MSEYKVDIKGIIDRLKKELGIKQDNKLSEFLDKDYRYISVAKTRSTIGGGVWNKIIAVADEHDIDLNWLVFGEPRDQAPTRTEKKKDT